MKKRHLFRKILYTLIAVVGICLIWLFAHQPSNDRDWAVDQSVLPSAEFLDNEIMIRNIRNFEYRSTTDYIPQYYDKTFDLDDLTSVYYLVEPFGSIGAAHTFVSFGFDDKDFISISIEIRKEKGESFSPWKGLLRQYELMYVVADERDVVKLRSNFRKDPVYLYPVNTTKENMQTIFIAMLERANKLKEAPEFYNTLTNTCTTNIVAHVNDITPNRVPWDLRLLLPENSDELAYELGLIDNSMTLEEAREKYLINERAEKYADHSDFSVKIRQTD
jgi:hypothetical protein